mgnify:FL=1
MKNKKGFTIIEIIVCIAIISAISISSIIILKNRNDNNINKISKKILTSAQVYANMEKDENGYTYMNKIAKGAKGVKIPLMSLVNKGYVEKDDAEYIYKHANTDKGDGDYYVLLVEGTQTKPADGDNSYCDVEEIQTIASWMSENKPVYLCNKVNTINNTPNIIEVKQFITNAMSVSLDKFAVSKEYYDAASNKDNLTYEENGVFLWYDEQSKVRYFYYRGAVENNYLKFGKDKNNNDLIWRIVWLNDNNLMKLVLDNAIPLTVKDINGNNYELNVNDSFISFNKYKNFSYRNGFDKLQLSKTLLTDDENCRNSLDSANSCTYKKILSDGEAIYNYSIESVDGNFFINQLTNWYKNDTNLSTYEETLLNNKNFCFNTSYRRMNNSEGNYINYKYYYNDSLASYMENFFCRKGDYYRGYDSTEIVNSNYDKYYGFLNYGDLIRSGVISGQISNGSYSGNYLLKNNKPFVLNEEKYFNNERIYHNSNHDNSADSITNYVDYYYVDSGINSKTFIKYMYDVSKNTSITFSPSNNEVTETYSLQRDYTIFNQLSISANYMKPAIILDISNSNLKGNGTNDKDIYELVQK